MDDILLVVGLLMLIILVGSGIGFIIGKASTLYFSKPKNSDGAKIKNNQTTKIEFLNTAEKIEDTIFEAIKCGWRENTQWGGKIEVLRFFDPISLRSLINVSYRVGAGSNDKPIIQVRINYSYFYCVEIELLELGHTTEIWSLCGNNSRKPYYIVVATKLENLMKSWTPTTES